MAKGKYNEFSKRTFYQISLLCIFLKNKEGESGPDLADIEPKSES